MINDNNVKNVMCIPPTGKLQYWKYYINKNLEDTHSMEKQDLRAFILNLAPAHLSSAISELLNTFQHFYIDLEKERIKVFHFDYDEEVRKMKLEQRKTGRQGFLIKY